MRPLVGRRPQPYRAAVEPRPTGRLVLGLIVLSRGCLAAQHHWFKLGLGQPMGSGWIYGKIFQYAQSGTVFECWLRTTERALLLMAH